MDERTCSQCKTCKPADEFGKRPTCRACARRSTAAWRKANPDKVRELDRRRNAARSAERAQRRFAAAEAWISEPPPANMTCRSCGSSLPLETFAVDRRARWGRVRTCKPCKAEQHRAYLAASPERRRVAVLRATEHNAKDPARRAAYVRARRAKIRKATVLPFSVAEFDQRMSMWGHRCWMCGGPFEHVDHVKPLSKGGLHCLANLRPACASCNIRKRATWPLGKEVRPSPSSQ